MLETQLSGNLLPLIGLKVSIYRIHQMWSGLQNYDAYNNRKAGRKAGKLKKNKANLQRKNYIKIVLGIKSIDVCDCSSNIICY